MPSRLLAIFMLSAACASAPMPPVSTPPPPTSPASAATAPVVPAPAVPVPAPAAAEPPSPPPALQQALAAGKAAIPAGNLTAADHQIAVALAAAGDDDHLAYLVARVRATRFVYAGDFEHAAAAYLAVLPRLAKHPELPDEFWSHNATMMIREAQGDPGEAGQIRGHQIVPSGIAAPSKAAACDPHREAAWWNSHRGPLGAAKFTMAVSFENSFHLFTIPNPWSLSSR